MHFHPQINQGEKWGFFLRYFLEKEGNNGNGGGTRRSYPIPGERIWNRFVRHIR